METFNEQLQSWMPFFSTTAQISGGLVGLVFVALTFNNKTLGRRGDPYLRALAEQTFADFVMVMLISLSLLVPHIEAGFLQKILITLSAVEILRLAMKVVDARRSAGPGVARRDILQRFWLSIMARGLIVWAGLSISPANAASAGFWRLLFAGILVLLLSGARSAWLLVVHEGDRAGTGPAAPAGPIR